MIEFGYFFVLWCFVASSGCLVVLLSRRNQKQNSKTHIEVEGTRSRFLLFITSVVATLCMLGSNAQALTIIPKQCHGVFGITYSDPHFVSNGLVGSYQIRKLAVAEGSGSLAVAHCVTGKKLVIPNEKSRIGVALYSRTNTKARGILQEAVEASFEYSLREVAQKIRNEGHKAYVVRLPKNSCLCEPSFQSEAYRKAQK